MTLLDARPRTAGTATGTVGIADALAAARSGSRFTAVTLDIAAPAPLALVRASMAAGLETAA